MDTLFRIEWKNNTTFMRIDNHGGTPLSLVNHKTNHDRGQSHILGQ